MLRFRLDDNNGPSRTYEFKDNQILVGFRSGCHIRLTLFEEENGELRIQMDPDSGYWVIPQFNPGYFKLNGEPIKSAQAISLHDVISCGGYRIVIDDMEGFAEPETHIFAEDDEDHGSREGPKPGKPAHTMPDAGEYLKLFFGPVAQYLDDDEVSEVMINGPKDIYIERKGLLEKIKEGFQSEAALQAAVKNVGKYIGRMFDEENPRLDARLPDGSRVHAVIPPLARGGTVVAIRKFSKDPLSMEKLIGFGSLTRNAADLID
ncbi:MAG: hypothetical protein ACI97B_004969, partial [Verrucomicrobiales bacterium]